MRVFAVEPRLPSATMASVPWPMVTGPIEFAAFARTSVPSPFFVKLVAAPVTTPPKVVVIPGNVTVAFTVAAASEMGPFKLRLLTPLKAASPLKVTELATMLAAAEESRVAPPATVKVPAPSGPDVTEEPTAVTLLLAPIMRDPALTVTPPVKVLAVPVRSRTPRPVLIIEPAVLGGLIVETSVIDELMMRPACRGATSTLDPLMRVG